MRQDEFDRYLENLIQNAKSLVLPGTPYGKAQFQGAVLGLLACEKEHAFTGKQVAEIINTALNYKDPGNEGSTGPKQKI